MISTPSPQDIHESLQRQCELAAQLVQNLEQESAALSGNDLQALGTSIAAKEQLSERLETLTRELAMQLRPGPSGSPNDMGVLLNKLDPRGLWGLTGLWQQLTELLRRCRQGNATNGKIITLNQRRIKQALEILRHGDMAGTQTCYSPKGASQAPSTSRSLGKV